MGGARVQSSMLLLAVLALAVPTMVSMTEDSHEDNKQGQNKCLYISRVSAVILAGSYVLYLVFQLYTHTEYFRAESNEEEEEICMSGCTAMIVLAATTLIVAFLSEGLVGSVEGLTEGLGISRSFIGVVLLPIVGNAAEHFTAVTVAVKDKMDLALGVALGSSTQIALFVVPFTVLTGWAIDVPMDLNFKPVATGVLLVTVIIVSVVTGDGQSNWLEGALLLMGYVIVACAF